MTNEEEKKEEEKKEEAPKNDQLVEDEPDFQELKNPSRVLK